MKNSLFCLLAAAGGIAAAEIPFSPTAADALPPADPRSGTGAGRHGRGLLRGRIPGRSVTSRYPILPVRTLP